MFWAEGIAASISRMKISSASACTLGIQPRDVPASRPDTAGSGAGLFCSRPRETSQSDVTWTVRVSLVPRVIIATDQDTLVHMTHLLAQGRGP